MTTPTWPELIQRLKDAHLELVEDFLIRLEGSGLYTSQGISEEDLRQTASETIESLVLRIAGEPLSERQRAHPARLGARRARQGVPSATVLEAVRLDFRVLWAGLVRANAGGEAEVLVSHTEGVLTTVEQFISEVHAAYLDTQAELSRDSRREVTRAFASLLAAGDNVTSVAQDVAATLGVRANAEFEVVCVPAAYAERARRVIEAERGVGSVVIWDFPDGTAFVRQRRKNDGWAEHFTDIPGGLVPSTNGLARVPDAIDLTRTIARRVEAGSGLATAEEIWPCIAHDQLRALLPGLRGAEFWPLDDLPDHDRLRLIDTVLEYAVTGSVKETAERLYCHRNTIVKRLLRFHELTGLDVSIPVDSARALIALGAALPPRPPAEY